jgi:VRR-NUC domain
MTVARQIDLFTRRPRKPPPAPGFSLHVMIADVLDRWVSFGWRFTHFPSGELRDKITAARLKRMGLKPGWPDFVLLSPASLAHFLELKRRGEHLSDRQDEFAGWCAAHGYPFAVADNFDAALAILKGWSAVRGGHHA